MTNKQKHDNFERVILGRAFNIAKDIRSLGNMKNRSFYSYTEQEKQRLLQLIEDAIRDLEDILDGGFFHL